MKDGNISFSPSVNIIRDYDKDLNYVVTKNAIKVANQIISDFNNQLHSFSIIGSYGTGKSSFIWAFEKNLTTDKEFFFRLNGQFNNLKEFNIINIIGSYSPIEELLINAFKLEKKISIATALDSIKHYYKKCKKNNKFLVIIIDEFGKILEYAAQNNPEERIYFLQQLAEFINDPENNVIFINTLHQNFNAYSSGLNSEQKQEWNKVRGRFIELTFNEPLEQLLFFAADQIKKWNVFGIETLFDKSKNEAIINSGLLTISEEFAKKVTFDLLPLDILSACILTQALKDYGQNERSLFTFLAKRNKESIYHFAQTRKNFDIVEIYDFLIANFYSYIVDKNNREKNKWDRIKISLDRIYHHFNENRSTAENIIKAIGILSIYGNKGGKINEEFLKKYFGKNEILGVLAKLVKLKIILFRNHLSSYTLTEGTDLDFYEAIEDAGSHVDKITNVALYLNKYYSLPYLHAKKVSYKNGTPRYFKFLITDALIDEPASGEVDGYIYLIFNTDLKVSVATLFSKKSINANIYVLYNNTRNIKQLIFEIQKVEFVLQRVENDKVAERELIKIRESLINQLNSEVLESIYSNKDKTVWLSNGFKYQIDSERSLNKLLTEVSERVFKKAPVIRNELINKHNLSTAISTARKNYIKALLYSYEKENLGFEEIKYPPEKTIFESLLKQTGIHRLLNNKKFGFKDPTDDSILPLWKTCEDFLKHAIGEEKKIIELFDELKKPPFKLKDGLINFWIPTFLIIKRDEYALFKDGNYIPFLSEELFDIFYKSPKSFSIRTYPFGGVEIKVFNKYRELFDIMEKEEITNQSIIETIKPFLLFYKNLPQYAKTTDRVSPQAKDFRNAIANAVDPYSAFFEEFPKSIGYRDIDFNENNEALGLYIVSLKKVINELRNVYNELLERFELAIKEAINYPIGVGLEIQDFLNSRFKSINIDRISPIHKRLLSRFRLPYENKSLWLESISMAIIDKSLKDITDKEEDILYSSFNKLYQDLVDLVPLFNYALVEKVDSNDIMGIKIIYPNGEGQIIQSFLSDRSKELAVGINKSILNQLKELNAPDKKAVFIQLIKILIDEK